MLQLAARGIQLVELDWKVSLVRPVCSDRRWLQPLVNSSTAYLAGSESSMKPCDKYLSFVDSKGCRRRAASAGLVALMDITQQRVALLASD